MNNRFIIRNIKLDVLELNNKVIRANKVIKSNK